MKKLRLLIVGDQEILSDYLMTTLELGHDILTCFTNSQLTKEFCEKETICYHDLNGLKLIKQYEFDYCIVFSNLKLDISLMQSTMDKWILLHQKSTYSLQSKEFIDPFESYNDEVDYWQLYSQQMSELTVIKQDTFTEEERNINEHLYQLLVNLSREDLQFHTMYAKYTKNIPSLLLTQLTDYSTQLKIDIKILLISALYALITRYFSFKSEQLRLGFILTKNSIESGLAREVLFLSNNCDESLHFETFARFLFQEIVMHTMKNELSILNKNQKKFEMVFCLSINSNKISCIPSVIFQFDFDAENIYINIAYLNENYEKVNTTVLLDNFLLFLKAIIFSQGLRLSEIKFLPDINQATNKNIKIPCVATVLELFEKNVKNFSGNIAVIDGDKTFTYHALEVAATSIADKLRELGVTKETFIPLLSDRSFELIAGIIGIMKAGACYVPISPKLPSERVQYILKLTQAHLILCGSDNNNIAESIDKSIKVLLLKEVLNETTRLSPLFPLIVDSNNLAYLLFTSGTTGLPKGVAVDHASLADRLIWIKKKFSINQHDVVMNHTSISFDVSLEEIFLPLISGGKLVLAPNHVHEQIDKFSYLINFYKITYIEFVPSLLTLVLELNDFNTCSSLKYVISGGEPLTYGLLNKFQFNCKATLVNLYGPTECTINAAYYICQPTNIKRHGYVPIGYPIDNLQFHVLDQCQQPVPIGGIGELYISGTGVARGYLKENLIIEDCCIYNNEQLNLYKTGDLVRYTKDFSLEFIGRVDRQIKLRGYRIELDEIECILAKYPNIKQVALIAQDEENNKKQLVAFLTSTYADKTLAENFSEKIKIFCRQFLPSYMIPNDFILIEDMLFTQSGKIDYSALSKLYLSMQSELLSTKTTGTELEDLIKKIWSEVLNRNIGLEDNFFDFGGNSLSAAQATVMLTKKQLQINVVNIFQYPTIKNLMTYINEEKTPYLKQSKIFPVFNKKKIPLSYAQHRLWYLYQLEGNDNSAYNISMAFSIKGKLNILYLESAIHRLIERHQILRTVFKSEDGTPWQELVPDFHKKLIVNINSNIDKELVKEAHLPFDIENGPLFRFKLYEITPQHHVFIITMHNIITDGWSESIIIDEINQTYRALVEGKPISLQPLTVQYTDYAYWQKQNFNSQYLKDKLEYWVKKLDGANEVKLFYDATGLKNDSLIGRDVKFSFNDETLIEKLMLLAQQVHTTPYVLLVAAFNFLLTHHTNQFDITIGSGMAGRHYPELEKLIGFFVNTVVLRTDLNGNPTWIELIKRVHTTCVEAHQYQDVPFEMIVDALQLEREGNKNPIFQILFIMQKTGNDVNLNLQSLKCEDIVINKETSTFDITFNIALNTSALFGDIQYNSTIFSREKIEKLLADFQAILKIMVSQPTQPIQSSKIINQQDFDIIMRHWNKTTKNYAHNQIHQLFEMQTKLSPSKIALFYKDENITYQELNKRANQLANYINKKVNVKNKSLATIIGISVERSIDYVISMFAILKVGGIFLPLDPDYPFERLKYYINHSDLDFIICKSNNPHLKELEVLSSLILLDQESQAIANENVVNSELKMNELCYIMYTSGSTGAPKGIMIKHTSVANLLFSMQEILCFSHADRFLSVTSINFDIFYLELLLPLISGATCILADQYSIKDTNLFLNLITSTSPTWIQATPSFWSSIINLINESCINIKILTGGEPLTSPLSENLLNKFKEIWNVYGPTETTIWSTIKKIDGSKDISLGRPIANTKCYVLNEYHNPVPMNVIGELYIAGKGLAQGYVNDSEATAYSFIHNPFVDSNNHAYKIMYKTGDLVCYQPNGELQFMGRNDQQVKIRGFRVELLEIEYQILKIDGIREAVVIKNDGTFEKESLVAFYTTKSSLAINGKMIQTHLAKTLPYYMIPSKLVHLPEIPKTLNNKTDRNKLLVLNLDSHLYDDSAFISPRTELEHQLLAIWGAVLNIDTSKISLDDSFFMLGGHSLLIPQVVIKINKQLTTNITIRDFIQNSTIDKLAQVIKEIQKISTNEVA